MELPHGTSLEIPGTAVPPGAASAAQPTWRVAAAATPPRSPGPKKQPGKCEKNREKLGKNWETWDEQWDQDAETWRIG